MASISATADWEPVENAYYRKVQLYSSLWEDQPDFDPSDYHFAGAPYSGALGEP